MQKLCGMGVPLWRATAVAALGALAFFVVGAGAATDDSVACGETITQDTKLDHDLVDCPGNGLVIGADGITLDLGGHTIDGLGASAAWNSVGIANDGGYDNASIIDGEVTGFATGVRLVGTTANLLRQLDIHSNSWGIYVQGLSSPSAGNRIIGNRISATLAGGVFVLGSRDNAIKKNVVVRSGAGITLDLAEGNVVEENSLLANRDFGVFVYVADHNLIKNNLVKGTSFHGIDVLDGSRNDFVGNTVSTSGGGGIFVRTGPGGGSGSNENEFVRNDILENGGDGIFLYGPEPASYPKPAHPGASGTIILGNNTDGNADDGIDVRSRSTLITRNRADRNGDLGIEAVPGVIDGGGNRARGNGNPLQCVNVVCS